MEGKVPLFTDDTIVLGLLMVALGLIFYTESRPSGFWHKFYKIVPGLFMAYMVPALFTTVGLIAPEWETVNEAGETITESTNLYYVSSRYLLPGRTGEKSPFAIRCMHSTTRSIRRFRCLPTK